MKVDFAMLSRARERRDPYQLRSLRIARKGPQTSRALKSAAGAVTGSALWEFVTAATGETEMASRTAARSPPPTRAGGQDDVS